MSQHLLIFFTAAYVRPFLSCLCTLFATILLLEEAAASALPLPTYTPIILNDSQATKPVTETLQASNTHGKHKTKQISANKAKAVAPIDDTSNIIEHLLIRPKSDDYIDSSPLSITLAYPSIGRSDIDSDIRRWITEIADTFEQHFNRTILDLDSDWLTTSQPSKVELHSIYDISHPSSKAVSITFELWNQTGGEHGNLDVLTLNYSLINGQRLSLSDIFANPNLALKLMSDWSRKILNDRYGLGRKQMVDSGTEPLIENFSSLTLTPKGVCINFQPYQVASWEMGVQKVEMPLDELRGAQPLTIFWDRQ